MKSPGRSPTPALRSRKRRPTDVTFAAGLATFFACCAVFLLVIAWALHTRDEAKARLFCVVLAVIAGATAFGAWAGPHWHG